MTNLEAFLKAHGMTGGTSHQYDKMYKNALKESGLNSITDLTSMDAWLDFVIASQKVMSPLAYTKVRQTYLLRFRGHKVKGIDK